MYALTEGRAGACHAPSYHALVGSCLTRAPASSNLARIPALGRPETARTPRAHARLGRDRLARRRVRGRDPRGHRRKLDRTDRLRRGQPDRSARGLVVVWLFTGSRSARTRRNAGRRPDRGQVLRPGGVRGRRVGPRTRVRQPSGGELGRDRSRCRHRRNDAAARGREAARRHELHSAATVKEAGQTQLCAYLSVALLVGLGANALLGWWWADPPPRSSSPASPSRKDGRAGAVRAAATPADLRTWLSRLRSVSGKPDGSSAHRRPSRAASSSGLSSPHVWSERQPQPMHVVSRPRIAWRVSIARRVPAPAAQSRSQSRLVGDRPAGSDSRAVRIRSSGMPAALPA